MSPKVYGIIFALLTALFWGMYGPALQTSRVQGQSPFKPFVLIGVAYLVFGVLGGIIGIIGTMGTKDLSHFAPQTIKWGFIAGSLGAFGALTLTLALFKSRAPDLVMPIVFGGATMVSVIIGLLMKKELLSAHPLQYVGTLAVIVGVILIQAYASHGPAKPGGGHGPAPAPAAAAEPSGEGH